jgi:hypothetical protein
MNGAQGADRFVGNESGRTKCARRVSHRDVANQSNHRRVTHDFRNGLLRVYEGVCPEGGRLVVILPWVPSIKKAP